MRSNRLIIAAINSSSRILADVFCESSSLTYTSCGYNCLYGPRHLKSYNEAESLCASFIRDVRMSPSLNTALLGELNHMYSLDCKLSNITYISIILYWIISPTVVCYNNNNNNNNNYNISRTFVLSMWGSLKLVPIIMFCRNKSPASGTFY